MEPMKTRALILAGQGAQAVGMGKDLAGAYPECAALFNKANAVLGYDLAKLCFEGPIEELTKTNHCQPAIFLVSAACHAALTRELGTVTFAGAAGLSLGEWTALYAAGCLSFEDTVRVLAERGRLMQQACDRQAGGMLSVMGLAPDAVARVAQAAGVQIANLNSPDQIVLSGAKGAIAEAEKQAKAAGAKRTVVLNVAGAYHSALMAPAADGLRAVLAGVAIRPAAFPVVSNVTGQPHGAPEAIREAMVRQVTSSVQWIATVQWFQQQGVTEYVECGPGKVLSGLVKRIDSAASTQSISDLPGLQKTVPALKG